MRVPAIVVGDSNSILRLGPASMKIPSKWSQEDSDIVAHFLQVHGQISHSRWKKSKISFKHKGNNLLDSRFPAFEDFVFVAVYFRQFTEKKDNLLNDASNRYRDFVDCQIRNVWIYEEQERFSALLDNDTLTLPGYKFRELFDAFLYGSLLIHNIPKVYSKHRKRFLYLCDNEPTGHNFASPDAFTSRILCNRHNNALASLDKIATRLYRNWATVLFDFGAIESFRKPDKNSWFWDYSKRSKDRLFLFNGHDIEQWLLKLLCGFVFSGNSSINGQRLINWRPDDKWLRILFGKDSFPIGWGLHLANNISERYTADYRLSLAIVFNDNVIVGLRCWINNAEFVLAMMQPDAEGMITLHGSKDIESKVTVGYRPRQINLHDGERKRVFEFYWDPPGDGKILHFKFDKHPTNTNDIFAHGYTGSQNIVNTLQEPHRNGPCPCGSGIKYKLCHGHKRT